MIKRKKREEDKKKKKGRTKIKPALSDKKLRNPKAEYLVVPSESRSLPWCLYNEDENTTEYPGTATDFIIRNLVAEFKTLTGQKIVDILCLNLVCYPFAFLGVPFIVVTLPYTQNRRIPSH